ncbi:hypothetical protein LTR17_021311 [Elasticomyces elasticus]|nr:hypothetical protein LTR17_021311 [Elasticomyces elasticus]
MIQYSSGQILDIVPEDEGSHHISVRIDVDPIKHWFYGTRRDPIRDLRSNTRHRRPEPRSWCMIRCENDQLPVYIVDVSYTIKPGDNEALHWMIVLYGDEIHAESTRPYVRPHEPHNTCSGTGLIAGVWSQKVIDDHLNLDPIEEDGVEIYEGKYKGRQWRFDISQVQCPQGGLRKLRLANIETDDCISVESNASGDPESMLERAVCSKDRRDSGPLVAQEDSVGLCVDEFPFEF